MKVRSIAHKGLRRLYEDNSSKGLSADTVDELRKIEDDEIIDINLEDYH